MSIEKNIEIVKRFTEEVINQHKFELIDEFWAADMKWHGGFMGDIDGIENYRNMLTSAINGAFTNMKLEIIYTIGQDDKVAMFFTNSGRNSGPFLGNEPSNKDGKWNGMSFYRIENEKIAEAWFSEDLLQMFVQFGFIKF
ncbi:ester cyclase [Mucilaginibacter jinjuensis]|uniref:Ester cyclase n=1 Tax=Mucilaginibacter jinjuensis TaxID=1176721 RepID=A0ABY7TC56_9SPHI|nr:ester cyclase [Mucilaginibacter jinjuensis]WCT14090.1 ester cyclase [Mucilaginibacter jinjuensis]